MTVISAAYTRRTASRILHGHDLSYGIYIYHMLVINALVQIGLTGSAALIPAVVAVVVALAGASWIFVERPVLHLKQKPARPDWRPVPSPAL